MPGTAAPAQVDDESLAVEAEAMRSNRSALRRETLVPKQSEATSPQTGRTPRSGVLARSVPASALALHDAAGRGCMNELDRELASGVAASRALVDHEDLTALQHARRLGLGPIERRIEAAP